jgi:radical SAM protein with 4Fe4S-binding SPASM domain
LDLPDEIVKLFHDVDFSIDFPDPITNDRWRGVGAYQCIMSGIERCQMLGVEASLVACLMKENSAYMGQLATLAVDMNLNLRINVYKSVGTRAHQPNYDEFWSAIQDMADAAYFTACSEPVVCAALGKKDSLKGNPCGQLSFRLHPDGIIVPCVYLMESPVTIDDAIEDFESKKHHLTEAVSLNLPTICRDCEWRDVCRGGCASRRILGNPDQPDEYCFVERNERPKINARWKESKGLVHENYLCTMIFTG